MEGGVGNKLPVACGTQEKLFNCRLEFGFHVRFTIESDLSRDAGVHVERTGRYSLARLSARVAITDVRFNGNNVVSFKWY